MLTASSPQLILSLGEQFATLGAHFIWKAGVTPAWWSQDCSEKGLGGRGLAASVHLSLLVSPGSWRREQNVPHVSGAVVETVLLRSEHLALHMPAAVQTGLSTGDLGFPLFEVPCLTRDPGPHAILPYVHLRPL